MKLPDVYDTQIYDRPGCTGERTLKRFSAALACIPVTPILWNQKPAGRRD